MNEFSQPCSESWTRRGVLAALLAGALVLSGCSLFGGDEEEDPPAKLVKFKPSIKINKVWSGGIGGDSAHLRLALDIATDGSNVYAAAHDGRVAAFEAFKGKRLWRRKTKLPLSAGPAYGDGVIVLGSNNGDVIALNAKDGSTEWMFSTANTYEGIYSSPVVASQMRVVLSVLPVTMRLPSGDQPPRVTCRVCPPMTSNSSPVFASQIRAVVSFDPY